MPTGSSPPKMFFLHSVFSLMSSHSSSPVLDSSNSAATWKRKYECLEAEHNSTFSTKMKRSDFVMHDLSTYISQHIHSVASTQIAIGRGLKQTVDMFREPREMVEENDHWNELVKPEDPEFSSAE